MIEQINLDLECVQSATFHTALTFNNPDGSAVDLTSYTAAMEVHRIAQIGNRRTTLNDKGLLVRCTTDNGRIKLGGVTGSIDIDIEDTATRDFLPGTYQYDLLLFGPNTTIRLLKGMFIVDETVTKP